MARHPVNALAAGMPGPNYRDCMTEPAFERLEPKRGGSPLLFLCDHASNALPAAYGTLGLAPALFDTHIASDIGAATVTRALAAAFDAPAILGSWSRLLVDLNRGADDPTLVMKLSDGSLVPEQRAHRQCGGDGETDRAVPCAVSRGDRGRDHRGPARRRHAAGAGLNAQFHAGVEGRGASLGDRHPVGPRRAAGAAADRRIRERRFRGRRQRAL